MPLEAVCSHEVFVFLNALDQKQLKYTLSALRYVYIRIKHSEYVDGLLGAEGITKTHSDWARSTLEKVML